MKTNITKEEVKSLGYSMVSKQRVLCNDMCGACVLHQIGSPGMGCSDFLRWGGSPCYDEKYGAVDVKFIVGYGNHRGIATLKEYILQKISIEDVHG